MKTPENTNEDSSKRGKITLGICLVIGGCCLNNVFLENMIIGDKACGNLLTMLQFIFISFIGVFGRVNWTNGFKFKRSGTPLWWYLALTTIFFSQSALNNMAYNYQISQPLHMVFRSSSLAVSLILGFTLFKKSYAKHEVLGVIIITLGVFATTFADSKGSMKTCNNSGCSALGMTELLSLFSADNAPTKLLGVSLLCGALFLSALLGHLQSWGYGHFGNRDQDEAMFFQHLFSIFVFYPFAHSLSQHARLWSSGETFVTVLGMPVSWMWFNVIGNLVTQYVCLRGVYLLISVSGTLTATVVLTVRKFVSLLISIVFFGNVWTSGHWIGTVMVFGGTFVYATGKELKSIMSKEKSQ